jgi:hypothetical protein
MMGASLRTLIKTFDFLEKNRPTLAFSDGTLIMLDSLAGRGGAVHLRWDDVAGGYPTAAGIYAISAVTNPKLARRLVGFQASIDHVSVDGAQVTSEGFRLFDGTSHYWWNGSAWTVVAPSSSSWNTEVEMAAHVQSFAVLPTRTFAVVVQLGTTDKRYTPTLNQLKIAYEARLFSTYEEILYRTLSRALKAQVAPFADVGMVVAAPSSVLDIGQLVADSGIPFNLAGVEAVFDRDADPDLTEDLLASYDADTKIATLTAAFPAGHFAQVVIKHAPEVVVDLTHPDYTEVSKNPSLVIDEIEEVSSSLTSHDDSVVNKATGAVIVVKAPKQGTLRFRVTANAPDPLMEKRMIEAVQDWALQNQLLRSPGLDEFFRLMLRDKHSDGSTPGALGAAAASCTMEIQNIPFFARPKTDATTVQSVVLNQK